VLEQQRVRAENRISLLMGRYPKELTPSVDKFKAPLDGLVATGIPSELLDNRPDVKQAALDLEAAKLDVKAARAAFYPALSIDGFAGYDAFNLKHLFRTPGSLAFDVAGNMVAPLLNRNAIKAQYNMANAQQLQAVYNYERALLTAFTEVATQLSVIDRLSKSYALQQRQVETLTAAIDVSNLLFQAARADYGEVLLTRRDALDAQMELIETKNQQLQARVRAFQALGGGWR
jgi:outer membrane protein TolC